MFTFCLTEQEESFLTSINTTWNRITEGRGTWLIVSNYPVPSGYNRSSVNVALMIPPGYPVSQIDMAYFFPHLHRLDGRPIGALAFRIINGIQYQRWSRHRSAENPWRPGVDDVATHLQMVNYWLERELKK
jgi:hypothetical protein